MCCLRGKAVDYVKTRPERVTRNYNRLSQDLTKRFGKKDPPTTARRQLSALQQGESEELDEFADKVIELALDAYVDATDNVIQDIAVDNFLKGCKDKPAAEFAMAKNPTSLRKAVEFVKTSVHNRKALYGNKSFTTRQVSFELPTTERTGSEYEARVVKFANNHSLTQTPSQSVGQKATEDNANKILILQAKLAEMDQLLKVRLPQKSSYSSNYSPGTPPLRNRSPSPRSNKCYNCGTAGHFSRECPAGCSRCNKKDHVTRDCPVPASPATGKNSVVTKSLNL
jgi:hypothetical protein